MKETQWEFRSKEHAAKIGEVYLWAFSRTLKDNQPLDPETILNAMREHYEYDEVFKGVILTTTEDGFTMFKEEDVLKGIKLN